MKQFILTQTLLFFVLLISCNNEKKTENSDTSESDNPDADTTAVDTLANDTADMLIEENIDTIAPKDVVGQEEKATAEHVVKRRYDLSEYGFNISIELPAGTKIELNDLDEAILTFGSDFIIEVGENYDGSIAEVKSKFKGNMHNQFMGYLAENDKGFVRKIKSNGIISHNLFYALNDGNMDIMVKSSMSHAYSEDEIMVMWKACETIQVNEPVQ